MRRPLIIALSVLTATVLIAACGDDDTTTSMPHDGMDQSDGMGHDAASPVASGARRFEVTATSFSFEPDQITVETGEDIAIVLSSDDILHDFTIDELDAHVAADAGETAECGLRADEPGEYTFYCTIEGHREAGMEGTLIVE